MMTENKLINMNGLCLSSRYAKLGIFSSRTFYSMLELKRDLQGGLEYLHR